MEDKLKEARDIAFEVFKRDCWYKRIKKYNHRYISAYEDAQAKMIEWDYIKEDECYYS